MGLTPNARGLLDQYIDTIVKQQVPANIRLYRIKKVKDNYHIQNEADFVFGIAYGSITTGFTTLFTSLYRRELTEAELDEILDVADRRSAEIRNAIFNAG